MSQNSDILEYMKEFGGITPMAALKRFGCMRLAARIKELRDMGNTINTGQLHLPNGKTVAIYNLVKVRKAK